MSRAVPLVGTVILNYRSAEDTVACLSAVLASTELDQRVIVADNTEDPVERAELQSVLPPLIEYLPLGDNIGYAAGNNAAIERLLELGVRYLWVLNPDTRVATTTLALMLATLRRQADIGILGPRLVDGDPVNPRILSDGGVVDRSRYGGTSHANSHKHAREVSPALARVDYVTGACMLIDARVFRTVGYLPDEFFLYFEETEFCRRAIDYGWVPSVDQRIVATHFRRSSGLLPSAHYVYYMIRNRGIFSRRLGLAAADVVDLAYEDLHASFIDPWRARVEEREPSWVPVFDRLVARAKADGHANVTGRVDLDRIAHGGGMDE